MVLQCLYHCNDKRGKNGDVEDGSKVSGGRERGWRLPGLLYADDFILWIKSEEDLKVMVRHFVELCRRGLKVNGDKVMMMLGGKEDLECEVYVDGR